MAIKRKSARQLARPKKRIARPGARKARMSRSVVNTTTHSFIRKGALNTISGNVAYAPLQSYSDIKLSNLINYSEFGALYDQFRINWVKIQFFLRVDPSAQAAASAIYPKLYWFRDLDDQTLASMNDCRERSNCKIAVLNPNRPVTVWVKPNLLNLIYRGTTTSTYKPVWGDFIDATNMDAQYYGIKWNVDNFTNTNYSLDVEMTYYFQCKNTR